VYHHFENAKSAIVTMVKDYRENVLDTLKKLDEGKTDHIIDFTELFASLRGLESGKWIDSFHPGIYQSVIKKIERRILDRVIQQKNLVKRQRPEPNNLKSLKIVGKILKEIESMSCLTSIISSLFEHIQEIKSWAITPI